MEQRAKEMGKKSQAAVYRRYINKMKEKTQKMKKESTEKYKKSLEKIVRDKKLKMLSKKDKETLLKIAQLMKSAND